MSVIGLIILPVQVFANEEFACKIRNVVVTIVILFGLNMQIDTHKQVKNLENAGFTDKQAESLVNVLNDTLSKLVSKEELNTSLRELELKLTIHLGAMMFGLLLAFKILDKFL